MGLGDIMKNRSALKTSNTSVTTAAQLTLRQSLYPLALVTSLFFLWVSQVSRGMSEHHSTPRR